VEQRLIGAAHSHRVDHDLGSVVSEHGYDLQEVGGAVGPEVENLAVVLLGGHQRVLDCVFDVGVPDAVLAGWA